MICLSKSLEKDRTEHSLDAYCGMRVFSKKKIREMPACSNNDDAQICWLQTVARRKKTIIYYQSSARLTFISPMLDVVVIARRVAMLPTRWSVICALQISIDLTWFKVLNCDEYH